MKMLQCVLLLLLIHMHVIMLWLDISTKFILCESKIVMCYSFVYTSPLQFFQLGRSKWNGNVGSTGVVVRVETPLCNGGRPSFSVQLNNGIEF